MVSRLVVSRLGTWTAGGAASVSWQTFLDDVRDGGGGRGQRRTSASPRSWPAPA